MISLTALFGAARTAVAVASVTGLTNPKKKEQAVSDILPLVKEQVNQPDTEAASIEAAGQVIEAVYALMKLRGEFKK